MGLSAVRTRLMPVTVIPVRVMPVSIIGICAFRLVNLCPPPGPFADRRPVDGSAQKADLALILINGLAVEHMARHLAAICTGRPIVQVARDTRSCGSPHPRVRMRRAAVAGATIASPIHAPQKVRAA